MQLCTQVYVCCKTLNQDFAGCYLTNREFYVFADLVYGIASTDECANLVFAKLKFCRRRMPRIYFTAIFGKMYSLQQQPSGILFFQAFRKIKCSLKCIILQNILLVLRMFINYQNLEHYFWFAI